MQLYAPPALELVHASLPFSPLYLLLTTYLLLCLHGNSARAQDFAELLILVILTLVGHGMQGYVGFRL